MADEQSHDPFDSLLQDMASSASPASPDTSAPNDNGAGTPAIPKAEGGATPGALEQSTAKPAATTPDQGIPAGTENPTDPAQAADGKGSLPDHLKPFETLLKSKQWDLTKPEGLTKALQSYQEAESNLGRRTTEANLLNTRAQEIERDFMAGPDGVNRRLEAMGFSKLDIPPPENRLQEYKAIFSAVQTLTNPNATQEQWDKAIGEINAKVYEPMDTLRIRQAAGQGQAQGAQAKLKEYRTNSATLFNQRVSANPELNQAYDAMLPAFQPGGVFHSFGLDEFSMTSSPERAQALETIGQAVAWKSSAYNPDGSVKDGGPIDVEIKKALALAGRAATAAPQGGQPPAPAANGNQNQDPIGDMLNSWARETAMG